MIFRPVSDEKGFKVESAIIQSEKKICSCHRRGAISSSSLLQLKPRARQKHSVNMQVICFNSVLMISSGRFAFPNILMAKSSEAGGEGGPAPRAGQQPWLIARVSAWGDPARFNAGTGNSGGWHAALSLTQTQTLSWVDSNQKEGKKKSINPALRLQWSPARAASSGAGEAEFARGPRALGTEGALGL